MNLETAAIDIFDAAPIMDVYPAADQDGYDGGFVATDGTREAWGETMEAARAEFLKETSD
jgi:hypothetical protein